MTEWRMQNCPWNQKIIDDMKTKEGFMAIKEIKVKVEVAYPFLLRIIVFFVWTVCTLIWVLISMVENVVSVFTGEFHDEISEMWKDVYSPKIGYLTARAFIKVKVGNKE